MEDKGSVSEADSGKEADQSGEKIASASSAKDRPVDDKSPEGSDAADYNEKADEYLTALEADPDEIGASGGKYRISSSPSSDGGSYYSPKDEYRESPLQSSADSAESGKADAEDKKVQDKTVRETVEFDDPSHIVVVLEGSGWIFTGSADKADRIIFLSRSFDEGKTVFSFRAAGGNVYILNFHQQNNDGSSTKSEIELIQNVSEESEKEKSSTAEDEPVQKDISLNNADISLQEPKKKDEVAAVDDFDLFFKDALSLMDKGEYRKAAEKLEKIRSSLYQFPETDRLYYLLGQCYEKNEDQRDPVKAEMYYSMVLDQFPFSLYYDKAETRKRYLLKYFINIR